MTFLKIFKILKFSILISLFLMTLLKYINLKKEIYEILIEFIENQNSEECETKYIEILEKLDFLNLDKNVEELER